MYYFDTIAAVSTASGGGIGIIRISGNESLNILAKIFSRNEKFKSHQIYYGNILDGGKVIDEVLVSVMLAPKTYTCEDVVEINCHGGIKSVKMVLDTVLKYGARMAEPGEFTKRAFLNGRIDLTQAEAVIDVINAKTELAQQAAVKRLEGTAHKKIRELREIILSLLAGIEVSIDYPEHDYEEDNINRSKEQIKMLMGEIQSLINNADKGIILKQGIDTVILGRPNVGKSSLMNAMLDEERAIVTDIPGTTRDILQEYVNIEGIPLKIVDTAGIRDTEDIVEKAGVSRSRAYSEKADLIFIILDGSSPLCEEDKSIIKLAAGKKSIIIINKSDLNQRLNLEDVKKAAENAPIVHLSAKYKDNLNQLYQVISQQFFSGELNLDDDFIISNARNKSLLIGAKEKLNNALISIDMGFTEDLLTIDLNDAYRLLGEILGETVGEDVIDKIFSEFCLGK